MSEGMIGTDLFGGPGGWDVACADLGWDVLGIEWDAAACATRRAAGLHTLQADVAELDPREVWATFTKALDRYLEAMEILIASPPCTTFSMAGKGIGRLVLPDLTAALHEVAAGEPGSSIEPIRQRLIARIRELTADGEACTLCDENGMVERLATPEEVDAGCELGVAFDPCPNGCADPATPDDEQADDTGDADKDAFTTTLVLEPLRWVRDLRPRFIAMEQVPTVAPLWEAMLRILRDDLGYRSGWTGVVNAADFGVPQTRRRAVLIASLDTVVQPPRPTHCKGGKDPDLFGDALEPWVSMASALGWIGQDTPARTIAGKHTPRWMYEGGATSYATGAVVGFPRRADNEHATEDGYRQRDFRSVDEPAPSLTEKARSWEVHGADRVVINTGRAWALGGTREDAQVVDVTEAPAPALTSKSGGQWHVEIRRGGDRINEGFDPEAEPAQTVTTRVNRWQLHGSGQENAAVRTEDEPAPTIAFGHDASRWVWKPIDGDDLHCGTCGAAPELHGDSDAGPMTVCPTSEALRHTDVPDSGKPRINDQSGEARDPSWVEDRPATTVAGCRDLVPHPGATANRFNGSEKSRNDGIRITVREAAILQSFAPDYPWQGSRTKQFEQVGNSCPPLLSWHILRAVAGITE